MKFIPDSVSIKPCQWAATVSEEFENSMSCRPEKLIILIVGRTSRVKRLPDETECNIMGWINVGLHVSASRNLSSEIPQGKLIGSTYTPMV
jgi:hypothetical protein